MIVAARGIILQRRKERESDLIVRLFQEDGKSVQLRAHGALATRKRSLLALEPGSLVDFRYYEKKESISSIREMVLIDRFEKLKDDYKKITLLSYLLELTGKIIYDLPSPMVYRLLFGGLRELEEHGSGGEKSILNGAPEWVQENWILLFLVFYKVRILKSQGLLGDPDLCQECGNPLGKRAFRKKDASAFLCDKCAPETADYSGAFEASVFRGASSLRFSEFLKGLSKSTSDPSIYIREINGNLDGDLQEYHGKKIESEKELYRQLF